MLYQIQDQKARAGSNGTRGPGNKYWILLLLVFLTCTACTNRNDEVNQDTPYLSVSENGHYLIKEGKPFFWLGDTGWFLFTLSPEEVDMYMQHRAEHGFNILQVMVTNKSFDQNEFRKNFRGEVPFTNLDPVKFNEMYFSHIDYIVDKAHEHDMVIVLFTAWGTFLDQVFPVEKPENAFDFGFFLGNRYRDFDHIIWSVCGEYHKVAWDTEPREPDNAPDEKEITLIESLARGLMKGHEGNHLMTIHPDGWKSSSEHFHHADWLDFNMIQSWSIGKGNELDTREDYYRKPTKPVVLAEPGYEFGGAGHRAFEVRYEGYHTVLNGGMGYTYGCEGIWNFKENWKDLLNSEGARQMKYLKQLFVSRSFTDRLPAQDLIVGDPGDWGSFRKVMAGISNDSTRAIVYFPTDTSRRDIQLSMIRGNAIKAWWYNPRDGKCYTEYLAETDKPFSEFPITGGRKHSFDPPGHQGSGHDWVLVLDELSTGLRKP